MSNLEQKLHEFEQRVHKSEYRELKLWKDLPQRTNALFTISKGTAASTERWGMWTPEEDYFGDSLEEVLKQAVQHYPEIYDWLPEFHDR